jgi:hypothetical protein
MLHPKKELMLPGVHYELKLPKPHLSFSQIDCYMKCPALYRSKYLLNKEDPPTRGREIGAAYHKTMDAYFRKANPFAPYATPITPEDMSGIFSQCLPSCTPEETDKAEGIYRAILPIMRELDPLRIEQRFEVEIAGVPVVGAIDVEEEGCVWDLKFTKYPDKYKSPRNLQLMLYSHVAKTGTAGLLLVNTTNGQVEQVVQRQVKNAERILQNIVSRVAHGISIGAFPLTHPGAFEWCGPRCPMWSSCYGS